jgi:urocanate hydratase
MPAVKSYNEELLVGIAPGTWVAISADQERVVATGATIEEAIQKAKEAGVKKQPFIIRVPVENSALIL